MYEKLAGMTGTAETEASEFHQIYKLDVINIPTNRPCIRKDDNDSIFKTRREKFNAIIDDVIERHEKGQPVLLGTISVDDSEILSRMLSMRKIPHNVLNAKNHQREAEIVADAGRPGAVTVATNMAGRGTDIKLAPGVAELGGLHVIGSSRHDSRRIDRQLRGRCSRQGDPGSSKFYVSLEDNLMRLFGSDRIIKIFDRFGLQEGDELQHPWLNKSIETAQRRVEQQHFGIRKRTLDFDDVMNKQREIIYALRKDALLSETPHDVLFGIIEQVVESEVANVAAMRLSGDKEGKFDTSKLAGVLSVTFPLDIKPEELTDGIVNGQLTDANALTMQIVNRLESAWMDSHASDDPESLDYLRRQTVLEAIDKLWQEHLYAMDNLRSSMSLRVYAQKDPLVEYKNEAFNIFKDLMDRIYRQVAENLFTMTLNQYESFEEMFNAMPIEMQHQLMEQFAQSQEGPYGMMAEEMEDPSMMVQQEMPEQTPEIQVTYYREEPKVGRNEPCPCGSGKKYKKCCGKE
jgi:preprotein translocase subunit SecA